MRSVGAIRVVAVFEALKGALVLVTATGLLSMVHSDWRALAVTLVEHTHLNPASKYPEIFLDAVTRLQDTRVLLLAAGAATYTAVRFAEAYGLFFGRAWGEVLAAASGAVYVPFELWGLITKPSWHGAVLLVLNLAVVAVMVGALWRRRAASPPKAASSL